MYVDTRQAAGDLTCGLTREAAEVERLEMWPPVPEPGFLGAADLLHTDGYNSNLQPSVGQLMCHLWKGLLLHSPDSCFKGWV